MMLIVVKIFRTLGLQFGWRYRQCGCVMAFTCGHCWHPSYWAGGETLAMRINFNYCLLLCNTCLVFCDHTVFIILMCIVTMILLYGALFSIIKSDHSQWFILLDDKVSIENFIQISDLVYTSIWPCIDHAYVVRLRILINYMKLDCCKNIKLLYRLLVYIQMKWLCGQQFYCLFRWHVFTHLLSHWPFHTV